MAGGELTRGGPAVSTELIFDTIPDGLVLLDADCRLQRWNRAMEQLTGFPAREMLGRPCGVLDLRDPDTGVSLGSEERCLVSGRPDPQRIATVTCTLKGSDGARILVRKYGRVVKDREGRAVGILLVFTDQRPLRRLQEQVARLESGPATGRLVGNSPVMRALYNRIHLAAKTEVTCLIEGETGTGKELVAEAIHAAGERRQRPLVKLNCSALAPGLLESELFGHARGAFTDAVRDKTGRIEMAEGGTLFLDEIGDLSPAIQLKLLRVLQERVYERVGETTSRRADVRFLAATHRNLKAGIAAGGFREDFYYRIRVFSIGLPPLRERKEDIPLLCAAFIERLNRSTGKRIQGVSAEVDRCFMDYCWPGNVRQLENALEHAFVTCRGECIEVDDLPSEIRTARERADECRTGTPSAPARRRRLSRRDLVDALTACRWNRSQAARRLGVDRTTVWRNCKRLGLRPPA